MQSMVTQLINLFAAVMLLLSFGLLSQRRVLSLIRLFTLQGATLVLSTATMAHFTDQPHLYYSAAVTLVLKVLLMPWLLHRMVDRLNERPEAAGKRTYVNVILKARKPGSRAPVH